MLIVSYNVIIYSKSDIEQEFVQVAIQESMWHCVDVASQPAVSDRVPIDVSHAHSSDEGQGKSCEYTTILVLTTMSK